MTVRVNLLPPEILEKRRAEARWVWVRLGAVALVAVLVAAYLVPTVIIMGKQSDLAVKQQEAADLQRSAERYKIFEDKQADLQARQAVADRALSGRTNWSRLFSELSLVLPPDMWVEKIDVEEETGLSLAGDANDLVGDSPDSGHKSIAKLLVRLADLDQLSNVWLKSSTKSTGTNEDPVIRFELTAQVSKDPTATTSPSVPAPPAQPAQNSQ